MSSPRLGEGRAEERGVRGATVSSSILRSWCDRELDQSPTRVKIISDVSYYSFLYDSCFTFNWCTDSETQQFKLILIQTFRVRMKAASVNHSHTSSWYFLSSSATSLCALSHSSFSFSCSRRYFSCYRGNRHMTYSTEPQ